MNNYKGLFYNQETEKKYYEGGAHFKYSDLVRELNKLIEEPKIIMTKQNLVNSNSQNQGLISIKKNIIKTEGNNNNKVIIYKERNLKSNLLTLENYKDIIIQNNKNITLRDKSFNREMLRKMNLLESLNRNFKLSPIKNDFNIKNIHSKYSIDKKRENRSLKASNNFNRQSNNLKYVINNKKIKNNLLLIESSYFKKLLNKNILEVNNNKNNNIIDYNKNNLKYISKLNEIKNNILKQDNIFSPIKDLDNDKNSIFSFKTSAYKNKKKFDTIETLSNRRNFKYGKLPNYFSIKKFKIQKND